MAIGVYEPIIRRTAAKYGIDPEIAVRVAKSEGGVNDYIQSRVRKNGVQEPSYGPFQLLVGGKGTIFPEGMGNQMIRETGLDPRDPRNAEAAIDFALKQASRHGWGQWYGAKASGISNFAGIGGRPSAAAASPYFGSGNLGNYKTADVTTVAPNVSAAAMSQTPVTGQPYAFSPPTQADQLSPDAAAALFAPQPTPGALPFEKETSPLGDLLAGLEKGSEQQALQQTIQQALYEPPEQKPFDVTTLTPEMRQVEPTIEAPKIGSLSDPVGGLAEVFQKLQTPPRPTGSMFRPSRLA